MRLFSPRAAEPDLLPYLVRDNFLSSAEISFYHVLRTVINDQAVICPKVRLADIFYVKGRNHGWGPQNRINQKHVDFLLCNPKSMKPMLGIELDDASHKRSDR